MRQACPEYNLSALIAAIDSSSILLPWGARREPGAGGDEWREWVSGSERKRGGKLMRGRGASAEEGEAAAATGVARDGVLPGGGDEAMSAPQKNTLAVRDHHRHGYTKTTRGPFRCVSNTKQRALCSPVRPLRRQSAERPKQTAELLF